MEEKEKKLTELEIEKELDQEEIIEFSYYDRINKKSVVIKDKRKIKVALLEMDKVERIQKEDIGRNECAYNPKIDDLIVQNNFEDNLFNKQEVEEVLEDVLQEVLSKTWQKAEDEKKIRKFLKNNFFKLSKNQAIALFMWFFLDFDKKEISKYLDVSTQRAGQILRRMEQILKENTK